MKSFRSVFSIILILACTNLLLANDLQIANVTLTGQNSTSDYTFVQFDIGWSNSWRLSSGPANWDAAWIFVKYKVGNEWHHATLNTTGETEPTGSTIDIPADGMGAFIYRSSVGSDSIGFQSVQLRWNYGVDGVLDADLVDVKVFGVEMVYVTQGSFAVGSEGTGTNEYTLTTINTADASIDPTGTGGFNGSPEGGNPQDNINPNTNWPNGYNAYYSMKYEMSQQQYVEFLNSLDGTQQATRIDAIIVGEFMANGSGSTTPQNNNSVKCKVAPSGSTAGEYGNDLNDNDVFEESNDGQTIACNYLSWFDQAAYADWAGLRPMTELEFKKSCRGIVSPIADEFPWASTDINASVYAIFSQGTELEGITSMGTETGNAYYSNTLSSLAGPIRNGIFASSAVTKNREETGGSFYGIMELAGNVFERAVDTFNASGSAAFDGLHGDGTLDLNGGPDVSNWPPSTSAGTILRGGYWGGGSNFLRTSDRAFRSIGSSDRNANYGGRLVRTAP